MPTPSAAAPRMILSSMSVMFMTQRTGVAAPAQVADEQVGEQERAEVADVGRAVDRRAARVDADQVVARAARAVGSRRSACPAAGRSSAPAVRWSRAASAEIDRPAPSEPVEVAGRGLDVDRGRRRGRGARRCASRISSSRAPRRGRARDDRQVDAGRSPAGRRPDASTTVARAASALSIAARASTDPAGKTPTEVAQPGRAQQRVGDGVQGDVAVGVADQPRHAVERRARRAAAARPARTGGCRGRCPCVGGTGGAAERGAARAREVGGHGHLEIVGSPGTTWTGMLQASSRAASSVHVPVARARDRPSAVAQQSRAGRPAASGRGPGLARSTVSTMRSPSTPLDRLGDRQRPGWRRRAVDRGRDDRLDERRG